MKTWLLWAAGIVLAAAAALCPSSAAAQEQCGLNADMLAFLADQYGEVPVWQGISTGNGVILVLTMNVDTGSWTVLGASADQPSILCAGTVGIGGKLTTQGAPS